MKFFIVKIILFGTLFTSLLSTKSSNYLQTKQSIPTAPRRVPAIMVLSNGAVVKYPKSNRAVTLRRVLGPDWDNYKGRTFYYRGFEYQVLDELFSK